jgi:hypothetical protein
MLDHIECIFIEILRPNMQPIFIGSIYKTPNTDVVKFDSDMQVIMSTIDSVTNKVALIAGDFNLNFVKHISHVPTSDFLNLLLSYNVMPTICQPTRISEFSSTLIDNFFVNSIKHEYNSVIVYSDISDHLPVAIHLKVNLPKHKFDKNVIKRLFDAESLELFNVHLASTHWDALYNSLSTNLDPSLGYDMFFDTYKVIFDKYFPVRSFKFANRMTPRHAWITKGLMKSCVDEGRKRLLFE